MQPTTTAASTHGTDPLSSISTAATASLTMVVQQIARETAISKMEPFRNCAQSC